MRDVACGMGHVACVQVSLQVGKVRWLPFLFVQCSFSFYWQPVACGMWQLHRLEVDAAPPTSFECGHITWKWAKSHTDQTNTLTHNTHSHSGARAGEMLRCQELRVAGHANSRVFVGQHFRLRSGGGFDAIWWLWSWPPNQTSFKWAVAACHMQHCSVSAFSALSVGKWVFAVSKQRSTAVGDVRYSYRYICIFGDSWAGWVLDTGVLYSIAIWI